MGQERLVGLALLNIHTNIAVNPKKLADEFVTNWSSQMLNKYVYRLSQLHWLTLDVAMLLAYLYTTEGSCTPKWKADVDALSLPTFVEIG